MCSKNLSQHEKYTSWGKAPPPKSKRDLERATPENVSTHGSDFNGLDKPIVWVLPKLLVCLHCGFTEFEVLKGSQASSRSVELYRALWFLQGTARKVSSPIPVHEWLSVPRIFFRKLRWFPRPAECSRHIRKGYPQDSVS